MEWTVHFSMRRVRVTPKLSASPEAIVGDVRRVREQISTSAFPNVPLYFTEWSTSYTPRDPAHDAYIGGAPLRSAGAPADRSRQNEKCACTLTSRPNYDPAARFLRP